MKRALLLLLMALPLCVFAKPKEPTTDAFPEHYYAQFDWEEFEQWAPVNQKIDASHVDYSLLQAAIFYFTNIYRTSKKLKPLEYQPTLGNAATFQSSEMAIRHFYAHVNPYNKSMRTPMERSKKYGFPGSTVGENIALEFLLDYKAQSKYWYEVSETGYKYFYGDNRTNKGFVPLHSYLSLGKSIVQAWINSPAHLANLLYKDFKYLGVGVHVEPQSQGNKNIPRIYATQVFGN